MGNDSGPHDRSMPMRMYRLRTLCFVERRKSTQVACFGAFQLRVHPQEPSLRQDQIWDTRLPSMWCGAHFRKWLISLFEFSSDTRYLLTVMFTLLVQGLLHTHDSYLAATDSDKTSTSGHTGKADWLENEDRSILANHQLSTRIPHTNSN